MTLLERLQWNRDGPSRAARAVSHFRQAGFAVTSISAHISSIVVEKISPNRSGNLQSLRHYQSISEKNRNKHEISEYFVFL